MNVSLLSPNVTMEIIDDPNLLQMINDEALRQHLIPSVVLTISMILLGVPGNILIIAVYMKRWKKSTSRIFILALAFNDLFNCLFTMPLELYYIFNFYQTDDSYLCKVSRCLTFWTNDGSSLILMGIAIDRLQRICKPFKVQMSISQAKKIVFVSMLASLLVAWPSLFIYGTAHVPIPIGGNKSINATMCLYSDTPSVRLNPKVFVFFIMVGNSVLDVFFLVVYGIILYHVKNSDKELRKLSRMDLYSSNGCRKMSKVDFNTHENLNGSNEFRKMSSAEVTSNKEIRKLSNEEPDLSHKKKVSSRAPLTTTVKRKLFSQSRQKNISCSSSTESRRTIFSSRDNTCKTKTTVMLFLVTILFIISFGPYTVLMTIRIFDAGYYNRLSSFGKATYHFFIRSYFLSNALNPLIYGFMSEHFRTECKSVLRNIVCW